MKIVFFGTSAGTLTKKRGLSAIGLKEKGSKEWILFDSGEATQIQILKSNWSISKLKYIFITHLHGDHIYGLFGLIASRGLLQIKTPLNIYGPKGIKKLIECVVDITSLHPSFELNITEIQNGDRFEAGELTIESVKLSHSIESFGFVVDLKRVHKNLDVEKLKSLGVMPSRLYGKLKREKELEVDGKKIKLSEVERVKVESKRVIVGGDNDKPELFLRFKGVDLMIHESTYTQKDFENLLKQQKHTTSKQLAIVASKMGVKKLVLTHISPRYDEGKEDKLIKEAKEFFKGEVILAKDFLEIEL